MRWYGHILTYWQTATRSEIHLKRKPKPIAEVNRREVIQATLRLRKAPILLGHGQVDTKTANELRVRVGLPVPMLIQSMAIMFETSILIFTIAQLLQIFFVVFEVLADVGLVLKYCRCSQ